MANARPSLNLGKKDKGVIVKMPDGTRIKFPGTMSPQEIQSAIETEIMPQSPGGETVHGPWENYQTGAGAGIISERKMQLLLEAERRGILPPEKQTLLDEARKRGLIPAVETMPSPQSRIPLMPSHALTIPAWQQGLSPEEVRAEMGGIEANPWVDPTSAISGGLVGGGIKGLAGALLSEPVIGTAAEEAQRIHPALGLPVGIGAGVLLGKLGKTPPRLPFGGASKISEEGAQVAEMARKYNLPLSPKSIFPESKAAKAFQWTSELFLPGKWHVDFKRNQLAKGMKKLYEEAVSEIPIKVERPAAGREIGKAITETRMGLATARKEAYGAWDEALREIAAKNDTGVFDMSKTMGALEEIAKKPTGNRKVRAFLEMHRRMGNEWTPDQINQYQMQIRRLTWNDMSLRDTGNKLVKALDADMGEQLAPMLQKARDLYTLESAFNQNRFLKDIQRATTQKPYYVVDDIFRSGDDEGIAFLKANLKPEAWNIAKNRFVENVLDSAITRTEKGEVFSPELLYKSFDKNETALQKYVPEAYENLKALATFSRAATRELESKGMSNSGALWYGGTAWGLISAIKSGNTGVIIPAGGTYLMARSLMKPKSWLSKWLTTGLRLPKFDTGKALPVAQAIKAFNGGNNE